MGATFAERIKEMKKKEDAARKKKAVAEKKKIESTENIKFKHEISMQFQELEFYMKSLELSGNKIDYKKLENLNRKLFEEYKKSGKSKEARKTLEEIKKLIMDSRKT